MDVFNYRIVKSNPSTLLPIKQLEFIKNQKHKYMISEFLKNVNAKLDLHIYPLPKRLIIYLAKIYKEPFEVICGGINDNGVSYSRYQWIKLGDQEYDLSTIYAKEYDIPVAEYDMVHREFSFSTIDPIISKKIKNLKLSRDLHTSIPLDIPEDHLNRY